MSDWSSDVCASDLAEGEGATILCGRFEGFDERLFEGRAIEQVSIGDYILSGGEMGALVLLDACIRLLPGVMRSEEHTSELQSLMRISYAVFCLKKKKLKRHIMIYKTTTQI